MSSAVLIPSPQYLHDVTPGEEYVNVRAFKGPRMRAAAVLLAVLLLTLLVPV